jgi:hypothetical protein
VCGASEAFGKTIWDATEFYLEDLERTKDSVFGSVGAVDYQKSKKRAQAMREAPG